MNATSRPHHKVPCFGCCEQMVQQIQPLGSLKNESKELTHFNISARAIWPERGSLTMQIPVHLGLTAVFLIPNEKSRAFSEKAKRMIEARSSV